MPRISPQGKLAIGYQLSRLFYGGTQLRWDQNAPRLELNGSPIIGEYLSWLNETTLIFSVCDGPTCSIHTYSIPNKITTKVSEIGADRLWSGGNVWAAWKSGIGYFDSLSRTNALWSVLGIDDDGTVLVVLNSETNTGIGYLPVNSTVPVVISYDGLTRGASIRKGIVIYHANGVLNRYRIAGNNSFLNTGLSGITSEVIADTTTSITTVPVAHYASDGNYVVGRHYGLLGVVVFTFGSSVAWSFPEFTHVKNADIRVLSDGRIIIAVGVDNVERPDQVVEIIIDRNEPQYYLFSNPATGTVNPSAPDIRTNVRVTATDVIAVYDNPTEMRGRSIPQLLSSDNWFGIHGAYLRGAAQYNLTAVIAQTDASGNTNITVKNSSANTWASGEAAYGTHAVAIRPDISSTIATPRWEVSWVRSNSAYARVTLDANLAPIGAVTNVIGTFGQDGILDLHPVTGVPLPVNASSKIQTFGYVKIQYPTTRGEWTIGQDAGPTPNPRLIAWNAQEQRAYVVWNGTTQQQSRLVLEYDADENAYAVVTPAQHAILVRQSQFLQLDQITYESRQSVGVLSEIPTPPASTPSITSVSTESLDDPSSIQQLPASALSQDTRVFRQPLTVVPSLAVMQALPKIPGIASTIFGSTAKTMSEDPPSYDSKYPYNTVLLESESGHLIEADDTPGAERVHIMHRSGTHIEMRPDGGVKYKAVKKRQDFTVGDHEIYIAGDCNIVTEGGYCIHIRKGQLVIDAKDGAAINVKGQLKLNADNIELKAKNNIFLNAPKVDIGAIAPGSRPMMSIPQGIVPYPSTLPVTFVPKVSLGINGTNTFKSMPSVAKVVKNPGLMFASLKDNIDVSGEPAFSRLAEQPNIIPLSNPRVYTNTSTPERIKYRERIFDTPEDVSNDESYNTHVNLCLEMNDFNETDKKLPGQLYQTDDVLNPDDPDTGVEPHPPLSFPLVSGSIVDCMANSNIIVGHGTVFTEDLLEGQTITVDGTKATIRSIQDDTTLVLTDRWRGPTIRGTLEVYRLRPFKDFFGTMKYTKESMLGSSGLALGNMLVNFSSPIFEVPTINTMAFTSWSGGGGSGADSGDCGTPDPTVPNKLADIQAIFNAGNFDLSTLDGCGIFVEAVVDALPEEWGHIRKIPGQTQYNGHAVDAIHYKSPTPLNNGNFAQVIDIIFDGGSSVARIQWLPVCAPIDLSLWYR